MNELRSGWIIGNSLLDPWTLKDSTTWKWLQNIETTIVDRIVFILRRIFFRALCIGKIFVMPANVRKTDLHLTNTTIFLQLTKERSTTIFCKKRISYYMRRQQLYCHLLSKQNMNFWVASYLRTHFKSIVLLKKISPCDYVKGFS